MCVQFMGLVPLGPRKRVQCGNFGYLKNISLTNQWPECIDIWYEALPCAKEIQVYANKVPGVINGPTSRGHSFV